MPRSGRSLRIQAAIALWIFASAASAAPPSEAPWAPGRCATRAEPVVRFTQQSGEIRHNSDWLSIAIYADGCVWAHRPAYYTSPGDRFRHLAPSELDELLTSLDTAGAFSFDPDMARRAADEIERGRAEQSKRDHTPAELVDAEGAPRAVFDVDISQSLKSAHGLGASVGRRSYSWTGLGVDAKRYPQLPDLAHLERAQRRLLELEAAGLPKPGGATP